jgi:phosphoribosylformimino-5-aminoimidazole carboxamide ribotide isomerase
MEILPAIDLLGGKCVRLVQGRYDRVIDYERDPVEVAETFRHAGAHWVHVIDLDGARDGTVNNFAAVQRIAATGMQIQFGGGVRDEETIRGALAAGAKRVIVGTRALQDRLWFEQVARAPEFGGRIALGLDARVGKLATHGWSQQTEQSALDVIADVTPLPLAAIIYTDIGRDGVLLGPNMKAMEGVAAASRIPVIAAGGVSDLDDVRHLARLKLAGVVIGRAIYEGKLDLREALAVATAG